MVLIREITTPQNGLLYTTDNVELKIGSTIVGAGTLYISVDSLSWKPNDKAEGVSIQWKQISVHGVTSTPTKCVYLMIDHLFVWEGVYDNGAPNGNGNAMDQNNDDDEDEGNASDEEPMSELWLIPRDINTVDPIFQAMKDCQAMNHDSADSISDESGEFMDDEDIAGPVDGNELGDMRNLNLNEEKYEDADD